MKRLMNTLLSAGFISALAVTTLVAQPVITVNEYGTGYLRGLPFTPPGGPSLLMPSGMSPDPFSGIVTLFYTLPFAGTAGDVFLLETPGGQPSDLLRFDGGGRLFFFSDANPTDPPDAPADVIGIPGPSPVGPPLFLVETGLEGGINGVFGYTPGPGMPGFDPTLPGTTYNFISDTPEPGSMLLCGLGAGLMMIRRRGQLRR